jgi:hypothetical protein
MIKTGKTYKSNNNRRFSIVGCKKIPCPRGFDYIGECQQSGTVAFFNVKGQHSWNENYNLEVDPYKWIGVLDNGTLATPHFIPKEELVPTIKYVRYLRLEENDWNSVVCLNSIQFKAQYK